MHISWLAELTPACRNSGRSPVLASCGPAVLKHRNTRTVGLQYTYTSIKCVCILQPHRHQVHLHSLQSPAARQFTIGLYYFWGSLGRRAPPLNIKWSVPSLLWPLKEGGPSLPAPSVYVAGTRAVRHPSNQVGQRNSRCSQVQRLPGCSSNKRKSRGWPRSSLSVARYIRNQKQPS